MRCIAIPAAYVRHDNRLLARITGPYAATALIHRTAMNRRPYPDNRFPSRAPASKARIIFSRINRSNRFQSDGFRWLVFLYTFSAIALNTI